MSAVRSGRAPAPSLDAFRSAFVNPITADQVEAAYERYAVLSPARILFQDAFANLVPHAATPVNFPRRERAPLLLIAGGKDHVSPASLSLANFIWYRLLPAVTEYKAFPERSHFTIGEDGWEAVADYALNWAVTHLAPVPSATASAD